MWRSLSMATLFCLCAAQCPGAEPKIEVVSLLTLVTEQEQIENRYATLNGKLATVIWEEISISRNANGSEKEDIISSRLTRYDGENHAIEKTEHSRGETRISYSYENGLLKATRGQTFGPDGKPASEEFWETLQYDSEGRLVDFKRGRGQKLQNHEISKFDATGHRVQREVRQGEGNALIYTEQYTYSGKPETVQRRIVTPKTGATRELLKYQLDEEGNVAELWAEDGYHVRWKYDNQRRVVEQLTAPYIPPGGCDECPLPGAIRTRYEGNIREQTFIATEGNALLKRTSVLERDGSIASIRYERPAGTKAEDAPDLYGVVASIVPEGGERFVVTTWDDQGNWTEKKVMFQPRGADSPNNLSIYRRRITYR